MSDTLYDYIPYALDDPDDPYCIHTAEEALDYINQVGFLPLFSNDIPGLSLEERTYRMDWWTMEPETDPWTWREILARSGDVVYGKFFQNKSGFVSLAWFPAFANWRRDGYDFDARWEDELATYRQKKIMDQFDLETEWSSYHLKRQAGFGKGGEKGFEGTVTKLQMQTYLCIGDFRRKVSKAGNEYGMANSVYSMPERIWGYDYIAKGYKEEPEQSAARIRSFMKENYPAAADEQVRRVIGV